MAVQAAFFLFVLLIVLTHFLEAQGITLPWTNASLHALCPFGAVETAGRLITQGAFVPKTHESNLWVFLGVAGMTVLFGALFCGWLCPLGSVQDWVGRIGRRLWPKLFNRVPVKLDRALGYLRYGVLALVVIQTTRMVNLVFVSVDPYYALFHFWTGDALPSALGVLGVVLAGSLFVVRPWCRWLCPFGALQGILQLVSPWTIRRNTRTCTSCTKCSRVCPMNIDVCGTGAVRDTRCNRCGECLDACPQDGCLTYSLPRGRLSIRSRLVTAAIAVTLFGAPIVAARQAGLFHTTDRPVVTRGELDPEEITSSMTLEQLAQGYGTDVSTLRSFLSLPETVGGDIKLRDLEDIVEGVTTKTVRERMKEFG